MIDKLFPANLLDKSNEEKKLFFRHATLSHLALDDCRSEVSQKVNEPGSGGLVLVVGPTGVGKSTLLKQTHKSILRQPHPPNTIPSICTELVAPDRGSFKFKDFYIRSLQELREPLIDKKILIPNGMKSDTIDNGTERYRRSLENALRYRQTRAFLIDEAQHFGSVTSGEKFLSQTDSLKSLANMSGTLLVLFGHYNLLKLRGESGQLIRRSPYIHFARYDVRKKEDRKHFMEALRGLELCLPVESQESLVENWDFFYERSLGCIGVLKDWFKLALWDALCQKRKSVAMDTFKRHALKLEECKKLAMEINQGEHMIQELEEENEKRKTELWALYGIDRMKVNEEIKKDGNKTPRKAKPGVQNPRRIRSGEGLKVN